MRADLAQLEQVLLNLALNASEAMPRGGVLTIRTAQVGVDRSAARHQPGLSPGLYAQLSVTDTGLGMDPETLSKIFDPFFTTKEPGKNNGLGLSAVYGIVKQSGGWISASSQPGNGTVATVLFPRADDVPQLQEQPPTESHPVAGTETILLVEDSELVRGIACEVLGEAGYTVLDAHSGEEALQIAQARKGAIHLLLADVVMPEMSGPELARQLLEDQPDARVLYMSGYTDDALLILNGLPDDCFFLQKPFTPEQLLRAVHDALSNNSARACS